MPPEALDRLLTAAHHAPSVGHSQPWRFVVVTEEATRSQAALLSDRERLAQAAQLEPDAARRLLDLQLEGIREAPLGVVVCCDRRAPPAGVLGRATFPDADLWSCACAIQNLWLAARAEGLGLGWVTLFQPDDLAALLGLPAGVVTLGWLCLGWPDERPPIPGLERSGWSTRQPLSDVVMRERWPPSVGDPAPPVSHLRAPPRSRVVGVRDAADRLLTPPGSLGVLDRAVDRILAGAAAPPRGGVLVLAAGRHLVASYAVSAYAAGVTDDVLEASRAGRSLAAAAARAAGLSFTVVDAGTATGDLVTADALTAQATCALVERGRAVGLSAGATGGLVALGEVGVGNTTVAAALAAALTGRPAADVVGLGAGADSDMLHRKARVVASALDRARDVHGVRLSEPLRLLAAVGGPEIALLTGVVLGAAEGGAVIVLDGMATSVAALLAVHLHPGAAAYLLAGQRSRERAHDLVLQQLGVEPLLDLRIRAGEGVGAAMAAQLALSALAVRAETAMTQEPNSLPQ